MIAELNEQFCKELGYTDIEKMQTCQYCTLIIVIVLVILFMIFQSRFCYQINIPMEQPMRSV